MVKWTKKLIKCREIGPEPAWNKEGFWKKPEPMIKKDDHKKAED